MSALRQETLSRALPATDLLPHARVIGIEEVVRLADWWADRRLEDAAMVAEGLNGWGSPPSLGLADHIADVIRSLKTED